MEKTTIEYLKNINKKREKRNEIKNELIKKIRYFYWMSKETKDSLIKKISYEFDKNENGEKSWNLFSEVLKQNKVNKEKRDKLTLELLKIKSNIQKEKRKYAMLKKMLIKEDFSWVDEYSIKKRKAKRDETKSKVDEFNSKIKALESKKNDIEQELSQVEVVENKKKLHNSWKWLEKNETNYKKYTIKELLNYNIWLSKELKDEILKEIISGKNTLVNTNSGNRFLNNVKIICRGSVIVAILSSVFSIKWLDSEDLLILFGWIFWAWIYILCKKYEKTKNIRREVLVMCVVIFYLFISLKILYD